MFVKIKVDQDLAITCDHEPARVPKGDNEIVFKLDTEREWDKVNEKWLGYLPKDLRFVGFISPQDLKHEEFEVQGEIVWDKSDGLSTMKVLDKHNRDETFRYELLFEKIDAPFDLYNYDPQIKNLPR